MSVAAHNLRQAQSPIQSEQGHTPSAEHTTPLRPISGAPIGMSFAEVRTVGEDY